MEDVNCEPKACEPQEQKQESYEELGHNLRADIKRAARRVKRFIRVSEEATPQGDDSDRMNHREMVANAILSYRALEDAAMRIGKCLQAYGGGESILDKMRGGQTVQPLTKD